MNYELLNPIKANESFIYTNGLVKSDIENIHTLLCELYEKNGSEIIAWYLETDLTNNRNIIYAAISDHTAKINGFVICLSNLGGNISFTKQAVDSCPPFYNCPLRLLDLLNISFDDDYLKWHQQVIDSDNMDNLHYCNSINNYIN